MPSPPAPDVVYALPFPVTDAASALALAVTVEERLRRAVAGAPSVAADRRRPPGRPLDALTDGAIRGGRVPPGGGAYPGHGRRSPA